MEGAGESSVDALVAARDSFAEEVSADPVRVPVGVELSTYAVNAVKQSRRAMCLTDARLDRPGPTISYVNQSYLELFCREERDVVGMSPRFAQGPLTSRDVLDRIRAYLTAGRPLQAQAINYRPGQVPFRLRWSIDPLERDGEVRAFMAVLSDVTFEDRVRRRLTALDSLLIGMRRIDHGPSAERDARVAAVIADALSPLVAEFGHAEAEFGSAAHRTAAALADDGDRHTVDVAVGDAGRVRFTFDATADSLFDHHGAEELCDHAGWLARHGSARA